MIISFKIYFSRDLLEEPLESTRQSNNPFEQAHNKAQEVYDPFAPNWPTTGASAQQGNYLYPTNPFAPQSFGIGVNSTAASIPTGAIPTGAMPTGAIHEVVIQDKVPTQTNQAAQED